MGRGSSRTPSFFTFGVDDYHTEPILENMSKQAKLEVVDSKKKRKRGPTKADLEKRVEELEFELEAERDAKAPTASLALVMTGVMSALIPMFSTVFSMVAGHCLQEGFLGLASLGGVAVFLSLSVSMPHLAHAISILTKSSRYASIALAIAFDLGVILAELGRVMGPGGVYEVLTATLFVLMAMSGVLNYIAFRAPEVEASMEETA